MYRWSEVSSDNMRVARVGVVEIIPTAQLVNDIIRDRQSAGNVPAEVESIQASRHISLGHSYKITCWICSLLEVFR